MQRFFKQTFLKSNRTLPTILAVAATGFFLLFSLELMLVLVRAAGVYPLEIYGTGNHDLEHRLNQLDAYCREHGPPRYLFTGNSKVGQGIDPVIVSRSYEEVTGRPLACVNFGFGGNTSDFLPIILGIVAEDYRPGKIALDLTGPYQKNTFHHQNSQWLRYRNGEFNFSGWMIEHFHFVRVFLRVRHWMEQPLDEYQLTAAIRNRGKVEDIGFTEKRKRELLEKEREARGDAGTFKGDKADNTENSRAEEQVFPQLVEQLGRSRLLFFELPLSFRITRSLGDFQYREERADRLSREFGIPLVRMENLEQLPLDSWMRDGLHMETPGIEAYSAWLGRTLAEMEGSGLKGLADSAR